MTTPYDEPTVTGSSDNSWTSYLRGGWNRFTDFAGSNLGATGIGATAGALFGPLGMLPGAALGGLIGAGGNYLRKNFNNLSPTAGNLAAAGTGALAGAALGPFGIIPGAIIGGLGGLGINNREAIANFGTSIVESAQEKAAAQGLLPSISAIESLDGTPTFEDLNTNVLPEYAASNGINLTAASSSSRPTTKNATVNLAAANQNNSVRAELIKGLATRLANALNVRQAILNAPEDIIGVFMACCFTLSAAKEILVTIEMGRDLQPKEIGFGEAKIVIDVSKDKDYLAVRHDLSKVYDDILRICRFRMRPEWLNANTPNINWNNWRSGQLNGTTQVQNADATKRFLKYYMSACSTNSLAYLAQRDPDTNRTKPREYYKTFLQVILNPTNGFYRLFFEPNMQTGARLNELMISINNNVDYQHAGRIIYINDGLTKLYSAPNDLLTMEIGAIHDFATLPKFGDKTLFAPSLFFRKLMVYAALFATPKELLLNDMFWASLESLARVLQDAEAKLIIAAVVNRIKLADLYQKWLKQYGKTPGSDANKAFLQASEQTIWQHVWNILNLIGDTTQFNGQNLQQALLPSATNLNPPYFVETKLQKHVGGAVVVSTNIDINTNAMAQFVFREMFGYDTSKWLATRYGEKIPYPCRAASLFLSSTGGGAYDFDPRDFKRWGALGYSDRMNVPKTSNIYPMAILRVQFDQSKYTQYANDLHEQEEADLKFEKKQLELAQKEKNKGLEQLQRLQAKIDYAMNRARANAGAGG